MYHIVFSNLRIHECRLLTEDSKKKRLTRFASVLPEVHHAGPMTTVCLSTKSDERYIVCGSTDTQLSVFDRQLNHRQALLVGHDAQVHMLVCICYVHVNGVWAKPIFRFFAVLQRQRTDRKPQIHREGIVLNAVETWSFRDLPQDNRNFSQITLHFFETRCIYSLF